MNVLRRTPWPDNGPQQRAKDLAIIAKDPQLDKRVGRDDDGLKNLRHLIAMQIQIDRSFWGVLAQSFQEELTLLIFSPRFKVIKSFEEL